MASYDSSGGEDSARFTFASWCVLCGHIVHSKHHAAKHFAYCPRPHRLRCGCCGEEFEWPAYVAHVNVRGVCERPQLCWTAPCPSRPRFNVSCSRSYVQPSAAAARSPHSFAEATPPPAAAASYAMPHVALITAASSSDTAAPSYQYSPQQHTTASASSTAYAETPATSSRQTLSVIAPLRSAKPLSEFDDDDLAQIIARDYPDTALQLGLPASAPPAASDPTSSSLRSPEPSVSASASALVQPLYAALSPAAPISQDVSSPAAQSAIVAVASPVASSASAASTAFPLDPHIQVALAAQCLWLARVILAGSETTAQQVTDEASRELLTLGGFWLTPLANPHEMPLHQLLRQLMPIWRNLFAQHRR